MSLNANWYKNIRFLDFGPRLTEPDGSLSEEIMPDFLHLSESGYNVWFDEMSPLLNELLGTPVPPGF